MRTQDLPMRLLRAALILIAVSCAAAVTPVSAQGPSDSTRVAGTSSARASSHNTTQLGPRLSPQFQRFEPRLAPSNTSRSSAVVGEGGQHVIVISTLALVLAVIIIVLLVVR